MKISIIIPNWNGAEKMKKHLPNVLAAAKHSKVHEIIVSDDASTDNSIEVLRKDFPDIKVVRRQKNSGFSSNVNFGVSHSEGDLLVLLNNDASPRINFLDSILGHFDNSQVFSVGCNAGGPWNTGEFKDGYFWHHSAQVDYKKISHAHQTIWVSGGNGVFRRTVWDELKGLDILFDPFYEEDVDLGYRALKRGYINLWEPNSLVDHYHHGFSKYKEEGVIAQNFAKSKIAKIAQRNQLIFIWKNITSEKLFREHKIKLAERLLKHPKYWEVFIKAIVKLPAISKKRELEKKCAKLTDEEILAIFAQ